MNDPVKNGFRYEESSVTVQCRMSPGKQVRLYGLVEYRPDGSSVFLPHPGGCDNACGASSCVKCVCEAYRLGNPPKE